MISCELLKVPVSPGQLRPRCVRHPDLFQNHFFTRPRVVSPSCLIVRNPGVRIAWSPGLAISRAVLAVLALLIHACPAAASVPEAPPLPVEMSAYERGVLVDTENLLTKGDADAAKVQLRKVALSAAPSVFVDDTPLPAELRDSYRNAVVDAIAAWNAAMAGVVQFHEVDRGDAAALRVLFQRDVAQLTDGQARLVPVDARMDSPSVTDTKAGAPKVVTAYVAWRLPYEEETTPSQQVTHMAGQAIGVYLGLPTTDHSDEMMGPISPRGMAVVAPTPAEVRLARQIQQVRTRLMDYATRRVTIMIPEAKFSVDRTDLDVGDIPAGDDAPFTFSIRNLGTIPLEIDARPTCGCTVADFDKSIAPGADGKIHAIVHTTAYRGQIVKTLDVSTNDPAQPNVVLHMRANITSVIEILPADLPTLELKLGQPTSVDLELRVHPGSAVDVTGVDASANYVKTDLTGPVELPGGGKSYKVHVTVQKDAPQGRTVFAVSARTTSTREPELSVTMICDKGILSIPESLFFGSISPRTPLPQTQAFTVLKHDGTFHVTKIDTTDPALQVVQQSALDGKQYQFLVTYRGGWPLGAMRGRITLTTDDPDQPHIEIPVMAYVIAGG